jgi:hypothetical protein
MEGEEDVESRKREREEDSSAERSPHSRSRKRSKHTTSIVTTTKDRERLLARNDMVGLLIKRLFSPDRSPNDLRDFSPFSHSTKKVNNQMLQLRRMVPTGRSNILLTDVKIFYAELPEHIRQEFIKTYRYVFFKFEDAIFSLKLTGLKVRETYLLIDDAMHFIFKDNDDTICTLSNLLESNSSAQHSTIYTPREFDDVKNCRVHNKNTMLRSDIRKTQRKYGRLQMQEYDNLVLALQYANDSNELQMAVPNPESLGMLLLKLGVGTEAEAGAIKQIFRNNVNVRFLHMKPQETEAAIDNGIQLTKMLQEAVSSSRGGSRRSSKRRKSRTMKKRK